MAPFDISSIVASPLFTAWQRAAADSMAAAARDPRLLTLGAGMLRSQLLWTRAWQTAWQASWAPLNAMANRPSSNP